MDFALFGRYFLDFALLYPAALFCVWHPCGKSCEHPQAHCLHRRRVHHPAVHRLRRALLRVRAEQQFSSAPPSSGLLLAAALAGTAGSDRKPDRLSVLHLCGDDVCVHPAFHCAQRPGRDWTTTAGLPCLHGPAAAGLSAVLSASSVSPQCSGAGGCCGSTAAKPSGSRHGRCPPSTRLFWCSVCR